MFSKNVVNNTTKVNTKLTLPEPQVKAIVGPWAPGVGGLAEGCCVRMPAASSTEERTLYLPGEQREPICFTNS